MGFNLSKYNNISTFSNVFRLSFIDKLNLKNTYLSSPKLNGFVYVDLKALDDFDSSRLIAAVFVLKLLTMQRPYVARFGLFQTFRERDYDILVRVDLRQDSLYAFFEVLAYEILPYISRADCFSDALTTKNGILVNFTILDLSFIRVIETHSAFFKWHDKVRVGIFLPTHDFIKVDTYLSAFKINRRQFLGNT